MTKTVMGNTPRRSTGLRSAHKRSTAQASISEAARPIGYRNAGNPIREGINVSTAMTTSAIAPDQ
jgi:hypothetical protein